MAWLPVDIAATIILELAELGLLGPAKQQIEAKSEAEHVYHVLNPTRFHWTRDMLPALAKAGLEFETLSPTAWLERLKASSRDPVKNPPIKLLDWFDGKYGKANSKSKVPTGVLEYLTNQTEKKSVSIRNVPDVMQNEFVGKMLRDLQQRWHAMAA